MSYKIFPWIGKDQVSVEFKYEEELRAFKTGIDKLTKVLKATRNRVVVIGVGVVQSPVYKGCNAVTIKRSEMTPRITTLEKEVLLSKLDVTRRMLDVVVLNIFDDQIVMVIKA